MSITNTAITPSPKVSPLEIMGARLSMDPNKVLEVLKDTVFKGATNSELAALVVVANEYGLNPFLKEIYAFPKKGGGIAPMVPIDGWTKIVNRQKAYDGCKLTPNYDGDGNLVSYRCEMYVKDRKMPVDIEETLKECKRNTEPWNTMPNRMLRHKAFMQAARLSFGLSSLMDEDEARDIADVDRMKNITPAEPIPAAPIKRKAPAPLPEKQQAPEIIPQTVKEPEPVTAPEVTSQSTEEPASATTSREEEEAIKADELKAELAGLMESEPVNERELLRAAKDLNLIGSAVSKITDLKPEKIAYIITDWKDIVAKVVQLSKEK